MIGSFVRFRGRVGKVKLRISQKSKEIRIKLHNQWTWEKNMFQREKKITFTAVIHKHKLHNHTPVCREKRKK